MALTLTVKYLSRWKRDLMVTGWICDRYDLVCHQYPGYWKRNVWSQVWDVDDRFVEMVTNSLHCKSHQNGIKVINIVILPSSMTIRHIVNIVINITVTVTNISMSSTLPCSKSRSSNPKILINSVYLRFLPSYDLLLKLPWFQWDF